MRWTEYIVQISICKVIIEQRAVFQSDLRKVADMNIIENVWKTSFDKSTKYVTMICVLDILTWKCPILYV